MLCWKVPELQMKRYNTNKDTYKPEPGFALHHASVGILCTLSDSVFCKQRHRGAKKTRTGGQVTARKNFSVGPKRSCATELRSITSIG